MPRNCFLTFLFNVTITFCQSIPFESEPAYILITADTTTVPIYVDGTLIGHTPIGSPIPVLEGIHRISHYPPSIKDPFITYGEIKDEKKIFVLGGDTVKVHLNTILFSEHLKQVQHGYKITNYAGIGLSMILLWQLWILSN